MEQLQRPERPSTCGDDQDEVTGPQGTLDRSTGDTSQLVEMNVAKWCLLLGENENRVTSLVVGYTDRQERSGVRRHVR